MANITTLQNTPIEINLLNLVNDNGWSFSGGKAIHESCNEGSITYDLAFEANTDYEVSVLVESISGGILRIDFGDYSSSDITVAGLVDLTVNSTTANPKISIYSNTNTVIKVLSIRKLPVDTDFDTTKTDTIVYSLDNAKWTRYENYYPDYGFSLFNKQLTFKGGKMYDHSDTNNRAKFYGVSYPCKINIPFQGANTRTFQSISIKSDKLLITTENGITTNLGQVSDLVAQDFNKFTLDDGVTVVEVYDKEGNFTANFLRDANTDIINGDRLKGNWITVELTTTDDNDFRLFKVVVKSQVSTPNE